MITEPIYTDDGIAVDDLGNSIVRVTLEDTITGAPTVEFQLTADACDRLGRALLAVAWVADARGNTIGRLLAASARSGVD